MKSASPLDPTRVGVIGAGIMGRVHAEVLADHANVELLAVASGRPESARLLADDLDIPRVYEDADELLQDEDVDLVCIATPDHLHARMTRSAAEAGKHIIVEKPFTTDVAEADDALAAVRSAGVKAMTLFNHRWVPAYAQARERIEAGEIGEPRLGYARKNDRIFVPEKMIGWSADTTVAWFLSSHDIDLMCWYMDDHVVEVYGNAVSGVLLSRGIDTPDAVQAQVKFSRGAVATFESCWIYPDTFPTMTDSFMEVVGTDGVVHMDRKIEGIEVATNNSFEYPRNSLVGSMHGRRGGAVAQAIWHVVECIRDDREPLVTLESSRHVTAVLAAAHESIQSGRPVTVCPPAG